MNVKHHLLIDGEQKGPYTLGQLQGMWRNGTITSETLHHMDGYADWMPLEIIMDDLDPPASPAFANVPASYARPQQPIVLAKSRGTYILLALFLLGLFGAHNFYAGRYFVGAVQLIITALTWWTFIIPGFIAIWVILECIFVTRDGKGNKMA
jgi:TM2 domain-containing membrane protein YozV